MPPAIKSLFNFSKFGDKIKLIQRINVQEKLIPNVLKEFDFHFRPTSSNGQESLPFKLPM